LHGIQIPSVFSLLGSMGSLERCHSGGALGFVPGQLREGASVSQTDPRLLWMVAVTPALPD